MVKYSVLISAFVLCSVANANAIETRTYNQPSVVTGEFVVEEADQRPLANLSKDTDTIQVESDFLGLKKFKNETFSQAKIKERFNEGWKKLREDESTVKSNKHQN
ncbi:hypothetical protein V6380_14310 [Acinetobacter variabilis]|uniref:hypothetical protein n=1 Tax=Acinetobacter variabilis TaxID=70346 RepID=UPI003B844BFC